jgi:single-stranded-DNA-specific exonuclease
VGSGRHLKLKLAKCGQSMSAIFFSAGEWLPEVGSRVDLAFCPQINEYRGSRSVQLHLVDIRPAPSRSQLERDSYEEYRARRTLSAEQARLLIPEREEFVALWRYLKQQTELRGGAEETAGQLARAVARITGGRENPVHVLVCLDVMRERGLIFLDRREQVLHAAINPDSGKVDLEQSEVMRILRAAAGQS